MKQSQKILQNYTQVRDYLIENGFKVNHYRVQKAAERNELPRRIGGGWTCHSAELWAKKFLVKQVDGSTECDSPSGNDEDYGVSETKARMQIRNLEEDVKRKSFENDKELGRYTLTETITAELGARARAFRLLLERFGTEQADSVAEDFGGSAKAAQELARRLGFEDESAISAQVLIQDFCLERAQRFSSRWRDRVELMLDPYSTHHWWTDDMREAWKNYEENADASTH